MKKDDFVTKDIETDIVALGYNGFLPVEVRLVSEWLDKQFPNSILREGYWLWREDLLEQASLKYPSYDLYYERRNYIVRLAIDEIINKDIEIAKDVFDADINALKIYLGLGYSVEDAEKAFYKVFSKSDANKKRYEILKKYIKDYDKNNLIIIKKTK